MQDKEDKVISDLRDAMTPIMDKIEADTTTPRAALVIAGRENIVDGEYAGIYTIVDCVGDLGTIGEALYTELIGQIEENNPVLFNLLREVIKTIEQEKEIPDDQPLEQQRILH